MAQIQRFTGPADDHWDGYAEFAAELDAEFNKLGLRDVVRLDRYPDYLDGEALAYFNHLNSRLRFISYHEMCDTLSVEFKKLEKQVKAFRSKEKLEALVWDPKQMTVREFADLV